MKKLLLLMLALSLLLCAAPAPAENAVLTLGQPFPDFTATDTDGNVFTLSEALKTHEAVLVNFWATWCIHCVREFPDMNDAYALYKDRVAFIALSTEPEDTLEVIEAFRKENGLDFPMARDENQELARFINQPGIPVSIIVDRFGNAAFLRTGRFFSLDELRRTIDCFLGDGYTETSVLDGIPPESSTLAFPLSAARSLTLENENAKRVVFTSDGGTVVTGFVLPDETARVRVEAASGDNPALLVLYDAYTGSIIYLPSILDREAQAYRREYAMPGAQDEPPYKYLIYMDGSMDSDPDGIETLIFPDEAAAEGFADELRGYGYPNVAWEYADAVPAEGSAASAYVLRVIDQYGNPVPAGVYVNFCTDTACTMAQSGDDGVITFDGAPAEYHVQLLKVPEGYSFDADYELYTAPVYSEYVLRIRKD